MLDQALALTGAWRDARHAADTRSRDVIADTVLVLDAPQQEVLSVLRFAGYLPSAHEADGAVTVAMVAPPRASLAAVPQP